MSFNFSRGIPAKNGYQLSPPVFINLKVAVATFPFAVLKVRFARHTSLWRCRNRRYAYQAATFENLAV